VSNRVKEIHKLVTRAVACIEWLSEKAGRELIAIRELHEIAAMLVRATTERKIKRIESDAMKGLLVADTWAVVHSFEVGQFFIEELCSAVEKNYRSFVAGAGEDWQIIGIFGSAQEAADAVTALIRTPGAKRAREGAIL